MSVAGIIVYVVKVAMDPPSVSKPNSLFQVYLRLRPPQTGAASTDRFLEVEPPTTDAPSTAPTHIRLNPPNDRRRAIEKFGFTQVFEEDASQLDVFHCTKVVPLVEGVLAPHGGEGTDGLLATLGVTGSGKSHTILGSKSQRGLTQLTLDVLFRSIGDNIADCSASSSLEASISASDASEATIYNASTFLDSVYGDANGPSRYSSRAPTPMICQQRQPQWATYAWNVPDKPNSSRGTRDTTNTDVGEQSQLRAALVPQHEDCLPQDAIYGAPPPPTPRRFLNRPSTFPQQPDVSSLNVSSDPGSQYAVLISMYEVYNDRIFDLLTPPIKSAATKEYRRRPLLFKSTEQSPDRKVVAGLRKIVCSSLNQALLVIEAGLHERRVAGTGSNSVSSRSHGFVSVEVKKRTMSRRHDSTPWSGNALTIVDLAGSERARDAKTAGATLAEAGKINESLMYLGQCLQMQSDMGNSTKVVPFRQCKLTELLFSNSFPSASMQSSQYGQSARRNPQKAVMIVTADPHGDFNATSQILRYSALAREVTVPRIPSITQTIMGTTTQPASQTPMSSSPPLTHHHRPFFPPGSTASSAPHNRTFSPASNASDDRVTMEIAAMEIARMSEEIDYLHASMEQEREKRTEAESHLMSMTDRMLEQEQEIREECAIEFEERLMVEMSRWKAGIEVEKERGEEHWDRKVEVMERLQESQGFYGDENRCEHDDKENVLVENLEEENERLRREIAVLKRELIGRSPSKRKPLRERDDLPISSSPVGSPFGSPEKMERAGSEKRDKSLDVGETLRRKMERLRMTEDDTESIMSRPSSARNSRNSSRGRERKSGTTAKPASTAQNGSPKKMRKLSPRKWDVAVDDDDMF
ncbi:kinesin family protein [Ophiostoma piceae UAMH 11346]|uniref:Kinesin family protein n=1 Tax=Ophiostoma piceae (strain UAMH 11346) TaxID=1262450 RepID=S3C385_OPHP1|nr:kinesin family protein [Ophiostoma piceae UAMH 11346]